MYQYYISAATNVGYVSFVYKLDFKMDSVENIKKVHDMLKESGITNPVILFFNQLN